MDPDSSSIRPASENSRQVMQITDQSARNRFAHELERNFSVIASAGSGKTRAISDRIVSMAKHSRALEWLPKLVVVTYTNRAADEMQQRTRQQILETGLPIEIVEAFNRAFFGTIHSFCVKLLAAHGHYLGLPSDLELITDDQDLWEQFVQQQTVVGRCLRDENRRALLRHMQVRQLMELARGFSGDLGAMEPTHSCPDTDFSDVYKAVAKGAALRTIPKAQEQLRQWEKRWRDTDEFVPWPPCATTSSEFVQRWREAFQPLRDWINACALCVAGEVQRDYRDFRWQRGVVTYADQVALAAELFRLPAVAEKIRQQDYRVILDEAQDTEPAQFYVLIESARPPSARQTWTETIGDPPRPGHFCMVGDFQQSIYRDANELAKYDDLHQRLTGSGAADELTFSVTFRLDQAQLDFVNDTFREILNNTEGQVEFVELNPRPDVLPGQVIRVDFDGEIDLSLTESQRARFEARRLAEWIRDTGPIRLRAESWRDIAILCPRKAWLRAIRDALVDVDVPVVVHSETERQAENPAYAWLTALLAIMVRPNDSYEIVGVLREIFGVSDDELARFAASSDTSFQIEQSTRGRSPTIDALNQLSRLRQTIDRYPLFSAIQEIVRRTHLRERLRSLPADEFPDALPELDRLMAAAANAEAAGVRLSQFATSLRQNFHTIRETNPSQRHAIQLITAHKSKGSEWQAVIVPFLSREVRIASSAYPRLINQGETRIVFDRTDVADLEEELKRSERQEMERLLYVALTRAKHTLVLAYDRNYFLSAKGKIHDDTQWKWLKADDNQPNMAVFAALPADASGCATTAQTQQTVVAQPIPRELVKLELQTGWLDKGRHQASRFIQTLVPSKFAPTHDFEPADQLANEGFDDAVAELAPPRTDNPATRYGLWWHALAQRLPWSLGLTACEEVFSQAVGASPDPARARREWILLAQALSGSSELSSLLDPAVRKLPEMPFFWLVSSCKCLEGIIDLAIFGPKPDQVLILDWKSNRIDRGAVSDLRALYLPQMAAYCQAVNNLRRVSATAAVYSTAAGQLIIYEQDALNAEWNRLQGLPVGQFREEVLASPELL